MQFELELPPAQAAQPVAVPVAQSAGLVYAGPPVPSARLRPGNVIQTWQSQWLETLGYVDVHVN